MCLGGIKTQQNESVSRQYKRQLECVEGISAETNPVTPTPIPPSPSPSSFAFYPLLTQMISLPYFPRVYILFAKRIC